MLYVMKMHGGKVLAGLVMGMLVLLSLTSTVFGAGERNAEGCLIGTERYDAEMSTCVPIDPPPSSVSKEDATLPGEEPLLLALVNTAYAEVDCSPYPGTYADANGDCVPMSVNAGEAETFNPPSILDNATEGNPYYPSGYDSQGCQVGVTTWGVNASGELDCIPIPAGFDPGLFNDANAGVGCPWRGNLREYENCLAANAGTQDGGGGVNNDGGGVNNDGGGVRNPATPGAPGKIVNPLKSQTIEQFLLAIIDIVLIFLLPLIVFFIIYGGFLLTTARGDTSQIEKGKGTLTWAIIGGVIVLGARTIIDIIQNTVKTL